MFGIAVKDIPKAFWTKLHKYVILPPRKMVFGKDHIINMKKGNGPDGGIGRRARLKIWFSQGSAGSIPVLGTINGSKINIIQ